MPRKTKLTVQEKLAKRQKAIKSKMANLNDPGSRVGIKKVQRETELQMNIAKYVSLQYPDVIFTSDLSGVILPWKQAKEASLMRSEKSIPDMFFFKPMGGYHALMLEIKTEENGAYLKDGVTISSKEHIQSQAKMLQRLRDLGYYAEFAQGFDMAKKIIDKYMNL